MILERNPDCSSGDTLLTVCKRLETVGALARFLEMETECEMLGRFFHNADGIHGIGHTKRVLFWALALSEFEGLNVFDCDILSAAARYHDIGRLNDWVCEEHGFRSVSRVLENHLLDMLDSQRFNTVAFLISYHCIDDKAAELCLREDKGIADKERAWRLYKVFKDCDGLDRVRIRDLDVRYLRTKSAKAMQTAADELLQATKGRKIVLPGQ